MSATFPSLGARLGKHSIALFCALLATLILLPAAARADFEETFRYDARTLTVGNLIGEVTVEGHSGSEFVVEVKVQGEDADPERILFQSKEGNVAELLIQFPVDDERRFVYPRLGSRSRTTFSPVLTAASARVVGTPRAYIASLTIYSRMTGPSPARPSPIREYGVGPEPFSWISQRAPSGPITSPKTLARPSPSCGDQPPN